MQREPLDEASRADDVAADRPDALSGLTPRRWLIAGLISLLFATALLLLVPPAAVLDRVRNLQARTLVWPFLWLVFAGVFRAQRLRLLLTPRPPLARLYALTQTDKLAGAALPGGVSETVAAWIMQRLMGVPLHRGLTALLVGRIFDLLVLLCLFLFVVGAGLVVLEETYAFALQASASLLLLALVAVGFPHLRSPERLPALVERVAQRVPARGRAMRLVRRGLALAADALRLLPRGPAIATMVLLTIGMHVGNIEALRLLLVGEGVDLGFAATVAAFVVYVLLRILPLQGLGGVGTTSAWWALSLIALGVPAATAIPVGTVLFVAFWVLLTLQCLTALPLFYRSSAD